MHLRDIDFGHVMNASGARGFFGEGYWFHKLLVPFGLTFSGSTFVAKTITLEKNEGNMPLLADGITPRDWFPDCIRANPFSAATLNAIALSNAGALDLVSRGIWQRLLKQFFLSFMAIGKTPEERECELRGFVHILRCFLPEFRSPFGLELNLTCANVGLDTLELIGESHNSFSILSTLNIPIAVKLNVAIPADTAIEVCSHAACDALVMGNAIPWGELPERINWLSTFNSERSPLENYGGGALGGRELFTITRDWIYEARRRGFTKPISACGGIGTNSYKDPEVMFLAGASAVEIGSACMVRGPRVQKTIDFANDYARNFRTNFMV